MNFNYRDFFIHNDDLHIIKEQLSIVDEMGVSRQDALTTNAKDVWDMYQYEQNPQKIADTLNINLSAVETIIKICLMKYTDDEITSYLISATLNIKESTVRVVLSYALGSEWKRSLDVHITSDAVEIYNLHKKEKSPEEIKNSINSDPKKGNSEEMTVDKVNLVLKIIDIAEKQMASGNTVNASEIYKEIGEKISHATVLKLIKTLNLGKIQHKHKFTEEQDAFILFNYLQRIGQIKSSELFNQKFSTDSIKLNILPPNIRNRLVRILNPRVKGETDISDYVLGILKKYFPTVNINDPKTEDLLTHYRSPETVGGRDRTGTRTNRDMSAHLGTLPKNFNTMITNLRNAHTIR